MSFYGPRGEPLFSNGQPMWRGLKGEALTNPEAEELLKSPRRQIMKTLSRQGRTRIAVSTVFLVLDAGFMETVPVLWGTMVFGGTLDGNQWRYASRAAAKAGHRSAVGDVRATIEYEQWRAAIRRRMHSSYRARWA
jgi:hypothetical protein